MDSHPDVPMGPATLRWVPGQGYVNCPHLFRVTVIGSTGREMTYEIQTFLGHEKAETIARDVHRSIAGWAVAQIRVEELGPTEPGGSPTAYDDRTEW